MAFHDDVSVLLSHLRHSFITNDETGTSELVMIQEDLETELLADKSFQNRGRLLAQRSNPHSSGIFSQSYDITTSSDVTGRPPRREDRNLFNLTEIKTKMKMNKCKTIQWKEASTIDPSMFELKEVPPVPQGPKTSKLTALLSEVYEQKSNPFFQYCRFDGENQHSILTNSYRIFMETGAVKDDYPISITIHSDATVEDLIGLTLFKYLQERRPSMEFRAVKDYCVRIAEDDGEIDQDLPPLDKHETIGKFGFTSLGITEVDHTEQKHIFVEVTHEDGGSSKIAVPTRDITMRQILKSVVKKRQLPLDESCYQLEKRGHSGVVDLSTTLELQGTSDFVLIKKKGTAVRVKSLGAGGGGDDSNMDELTQTSQAAAELSSFNYFKYKTYYATMQTKVRSKTKIQLGISWDQVDIRPLEKGIFAAKPASYEMDRICMSECHEEKGGKVMVRIVRLGKDGTFKDMEFEVQNQRQGNQISQQVEVIVKSRHTRGRKLYMEQLSVKK